jgi:hypothetical protein
MSKRSFLAFPIAVLVITGTLAAQSDPISNCRSRAAVLSNTVFWNTTAERRGGLPNGNDMILWKAKLSDNQIVTGFCVANPQTGRIVRLGADQDSEGLKRAYRILPAEAERACATEARARFSPGNGMLYAFFLPNTSTKSTYRVEWRYGNMAGTIRTGHCEIDPFTGTIREFNANLGW